MSEEMKKEVARDAANVGTPMVYQCCGRQECMSDCPNGGPWELRPAWRMNAYYYAFQPTGIAAIDLIMSAVACAGKAFHYTEQWNEDIGGPYHSALRGDSPVEWIQNAANDAAEAIKAMLATAQAAQGKHDLPQ